MAFENLADDIDNLRAKKPRFFKQWLELASPEDRATVMEAIHDNRISPNNLAVLLTKKYDIPITRETILEYRVRGAK